MKNVVIGIFGGMLFLYATMLALSIYAIESRKNELENCLSEVVYETLDACYVPAVLREDGYAPADEVQIGQQITAELSRRIHSDTAYTVTIIACDMEKGILSVRVDEKYTLPTGKEKSRHFAKTAIVE